MGEKKGGSCFSIQSGGRGRMVFSLYKFFAWTAQQTRKGRRQPPPLQGQEWRGTWEHGKNHHNKIVVWTSKNLVDFFTKLWVVFQDRRTCRLLFVGKRGLVRCRWHIAYMWYGRREGGRGKSDEQAATKEERRLGRQPGTEIYQCLRKFTNTLCMVH